MISKVVFFRYMPLTELICKGHFMDWLLENGILVQYLDMSSLFYPNYEFQDETSRDYVTKINSYNDFETFIKGQDKEKTLFISIVSFEWRVYKLFRILTKHDCKLGVFARGMFPAPASSHSKRIKRILNCFNVKKILSLIKNQISYYSKKYGFIKRYDVVFLTGEQALPAIGVGFKFDSKKCKIIEVNTTDYDNFIESCNIPSTSIPYAVFLDDNLPSHPDTKLFNINTIKENEYYPELIDFFSKIEADLKVKVVIAAHPKAINYKNSNPFAGRDIHFDMTNTLIANSDFVIVHDSTSIGYAVLHMKPILSITSSKFKESLPENHECVLSFSKYLNTCLLFYDSYNKNEINLSVDKDKYSSYKFDFLTNKGTQNTLTKILFLESLNYL